MRFAEALLECGAEVHIASPRRNKFVYGLPAGCRHTYSHRSPQRSLTAAIYSSNPYIIIPGDDRILHALILLHRTRHNSFGPLDRIVQLIEFSLGNLNSYSVLMQRAAFMAEAMALGIRALHTSVVFDLGALAKLSEGLGYPIILKLDQTSGGAGTVLANSREDAKAKAGMLLSRGRAVRKNIGDFLRGEGSLLTEKWLGNKPVLNAQRHVGGRPATTAFSCWNGKLLAAIHAEVVQEAWPRGPATVVKFFCDSALNANAEKVASRFCLSGIHGLDYILEDRTNVPWLIEMNPRLTQIAHFALGDGRDIAAQFLAASTGFFVPNRSTAAGSNTVALFPQEWLRDRNSSYLGTASGDVPRNNPAFVRAILGELPDKRQ